MIYNVEAIPDFKRESKQLVKKFRSLRQELENLMEILETKPRTGTSLGNNC